MIRARRRESDSLAESDAKRSRTELILQGETRW
jgi:hypothetical protein